MARCATALISNYKVKERRCFSTSDCILADCGQPLFSASGLPRRSLDSAVVSVLVGWLLSGTVNLLGVPALGSDGCFRRQGSVTAGRECRALLLEGERGSPPAPRPRKAPQLGAAGGLPASGLLAWHAGLRDCAGDSLGRALPAFLPPRLRCCGPVPYARPE